VKSPPRLTVALLAILAATAAAGCGSKGTSGNRDLESLCRRERAALVRVSPVADLGDAERTLRNVIALERRVLAGLRESSLADDPLATKLRFSIAASTRSLEAITGDAQGAMDPVRTGVPSARRAVGGADGLLRSLCGSSRA
jgi:hypothetical protein